LRLPNAGRIARKCSLDGRYDLAMTKDELYEQIDLMTDEEAARVKLIFAPDWPSRATSIEEIRNGPGPRR
jgi:hypothetical protein